MSNRRERGLLAEMTTLGWVMASTHNEALTRISELEAALKQVACDCNGEAGCKSYALYYKLCPASETKGDAGG